ncbi:MAG TPA: tetratricopeptide repeat protein [Candidatus Omnitrophota bacterium]|nr:tetratricopeptide repeat protein [Candidatus Omnitrophota bacterium]HPT06746.1 tetratricopeptide repeat protein [Candidatus Omnitrophota bacterium]
MKNPTRNNSIIFLCSFLCVVGFVSFAFADENDLKNANHGYIVSSQVEEVKPRPAPRVASRAPARTKPAQTSNRREFLTELQQQARMYRQQGLQFQNIGNIDQAMMLYQKAVELDPSYAVAYNDLGVLFEGMDEPDRAEQNYLKAVQVDPAFASAYSNLAIFYENKRDLPQAEYYWKKRIEYGLVDDPWTSKAQKRLADIKLVLGEQPYPVQLEKEQDVVNLMQDVSAKKAVLNRDQKALARDYFEKAKRNYLKREYVLAWKQAVDAQLMDPSNDEITAFVEKLQSTLLSKSR